MLEIKLQVTLYLDVFVWLVFEELKQQMVMLLTEAEGSHHLAHPTCLMSKISHTDSGISLEFHWLSLDAIGKPLVLQGSALAILAFTVCFW